MPIYKIKLLQQQEVAAQTHQFTFTKPEGFNFTPGQYGGFTLINPQESDSLGMTRRFSFSSSPLDTESAIAMRIKNPDTEGSAFKRVLKSLPLQSELKLAGPSGLFTLHEDTTIPAVFIAGGIGITPFYSMLRTLSLSSQHRPVILFYGNQTRKEAAFLSTLIDFQKKLPQFKCVPTVTYKDEDWLYAEGFITHALIKNHIQDLDNGIYYVCGSLNMVNAMRELLTEMGINEANIRAEDFPGY